MRFVRVHDRVRRRLQGHVYNVYRRLVSPDPDCRLWICFPSIDQPLP